MTDLQSAVAAYTALERKVHAAWLPMSSRVCAACAETCCRPDACQEALDSDWLRLVGAAAYGDWIPADAEERCKTECVALRADGCLLEVGRPPICRAYFCYPVLDACADEFEVLFYAFVAQVPWMVSRLTRQVTLTEVPEARLAAQAGRIRAAVRRVDGLFELARGLVSREASEVEKLRIALALLCLDGSFLKQGPRERVLRALAARGIAVPQP